MNVQSVKFDDGNFVALCTTKDSKRTIEVLLDVPESKLCWLVETSISHGLDSYEVLNYTQQLLHEKHGRAN
jgi:hypothetical protein